MSNKKDIFGDELKSTNINDFATLFEQSTSTIGRKLKVGDSFNGEILSINKEEAFLATSTTQDAMILISDLLDEETTEV